MKKLLPLFVLLILFTTSLSAQQPAAGTAQWKDKAIGKWKYMGVEQFGVVDTTNAATRNDMLEIKADGTYSKVEEGKTSNGTYVIAQATATITFKDASTGKSKLYYLKKAPAGKLLIEYQTPDLIRTRYQYVKMK